jgi:hypothetical protein
MDRRAEQKRTLSAPRRNPGMLARLLFFTMDLFYGRKRRWPMRSARSASTSGTTRTRASRASATRASPEGPARDKRTDEVMCLERLRIAI